MGFSKTQRFALSAQKAVSLGVFLRFYEIVSRFPKAAKVSVDDRQKERYCASMGGQRRHAVYMTCLAGSRFNPYYNKNSTTLAYSLLQSLHKSSASTVYGSLEKTIKSKCRPLKRIVNKLKSTAKTLGLVFVKMSRNLHVRLIANAEIPFNALT